MDRRNTKFSYNAPDYRNVVEEREAMMPRVPRQRRKKCPCDELYADGSEQSSMCQCAKHHTTAPATPQEHMPMMVRVGNVFDSMDLKQMLLFAGVGVLFVLAADGLVRLASRRVNKEGAITIEGKTYVPL